MGLGGIGWGRVCRSSMASAGYTFSGEMILGAATSSITGYSPPYVHSVCVSVYFAPTKSLARAYFLSEPTGKVLGAGIFCPD